MNLPDLRAWVFDAPGRKPLDPDNQQGMISMVDRLSRQELDDVIAYLQTLGQPPIVPQEGVIE